MQLTRLTLLILLSLFFGLTSCKDELRLTPSGVIKHIDNPENGFIKTHESHDFTTRIQYRPPEYMASIAIGTDNITQRGIDNEIEKFKGVNFFLLEIESNSPIDVLGDQLPDESYNERLNYLLGPCANDLILTNEEDTLTPEAYHFERDYGVKKGVRIIVGFEDCSKTKGWKIYFADRVFDKGIKVFEYSVDDINLVPELIGKE